ncbi:uncharacterized protein BKA55DRAFT_710791 [Fusarium redolens]|uniref:F-box domain-containing protein n=1 Tax=Fusarium redolens TaxID=48865 RepID=A0A9P9G4E7_FUSRE|nr:uncharacterized protein BKA55DRAFT_710791 [Fusarium redolens]KAH7232306.1 hypothetical protein BKA55DRAFT_710791 [Fusarium redolens]
MPHTSASTSRELLIFTMHLLLILLVWLRKLFTYFKANVKPTDEIVMLIINDIYKGTDKPSIFAFFVLRQVSQRFRRLTQDKTFDSHVFSNKDCCERCLSSSGFWARKENTPTVTDNLDGSSCRERHCFGYKINRAGICSKGLGDLIRKEKLCSPCQTRLDVRESCDVSVNANLHPDIHWTGNFALLVKLITLLYAFQPVSKYVSPGQVIFAYVNIRCSAGMVSNTLLQALPQPSKQRERTRSRHANIRATVHLVTTELASQRFS